MSLITPTTADINATIIAQLEATLNQTIPSFPKSFLRTLAKVLAGVFILLFKYSGFMFEQIFVSTASDQETIVNGVVIVPLTEWGRLIGIGDPTAAVQAELTVDITVTNQIGVLPSGTQLFGSTNGVTYITIGDVPLDAPTKSATIRAVSDQAGGDGSGVIGNLDNGAIVSFANPLANIVRDTVVTATTTVGVNAEDTEVYRQRVIDGFQKRPQGGATADYEVWGEEVAGIINVYPYTGGQAGTVDVFSEADPSIEPDGIPPPALLLEVLDSIELDQAGIPTRRPANAFVNSLAIIRTTFDVRVTALDIPTDQPSTEADITEAIEDFFRDAEPFIVGLTPAPRRDRITANALNGIVQQIVNAAGGVYGTAVMTTGAVDLAIYNLGQGEKAKSGVITFP